MIQRLLYAAAIWAAAATAAFAQASSGTFGESGRAEEPMELDQSETTIETTEEAPPADGGFWMFPEPAPMTGRIATDRPAFSDTASLVPRGRIQIEGGYQFTYDREGKKRTYDHLFPETALRTGLTDWLEFRMKWNGYSLTETTDQFTTRAGRRISRESHDDSGTDLTLGHPVVDRADRRGGQDGGQRRARGEVPLELRNHRRLGRLRLVFRPRQRRARRAVLPERRDPGDGLRRA
jgi:hypothetical protein